MSCQTTVAQTQFKDQGLTQKNKSQPLDTEEIVTWKIPGMGKMNVLKKFETEMMKKGK